MTEKFVEVKGRVVHLLKTMAQGRAVDVIWWEPSAGGLTLYLEGCLEEGGSSPASHQFDLDSLERFSELDAQTELQSQLRRIVARFARRPTPRAFRGG